MRDIEKAKRLFRKAGLAFPTIPEELTARLKEQSEWLFSTREVNVSPYILEHYVREADKSHLHDYVVLSHSGHGVNSYALQYYVVHGPLRMFLHLGWGGVYMDAKATAANVRDCFLLADKIVLAAQTAGRLQASDRLMIVASDFYGSYWSPPGKSHREKDAAFKGPADVLTEVLRWLRSSRPGKRQR